MKTTIELAREAGFSAKQTDVYFDRQLKTFAALLRAEWEAAQPRQEPVGFVGAGYITLGEGRISETQTDVYRVPVYTAPPAAQPQPLTDEHIAELLIKHLESNDGYYQFARAIEAHHNIRSKE